MVTMIYVVFSRNIQWLPFLNKAHTFIQIGNEAHPKHSQIVYKYFPKIIHINEARCVVLVLSVVYVIGHNI